MKRKCTGAGTPCVDAGGVVPNTVGDPPPPPPALNTASGLSSPLILSMETAAKTDTGLSSSMSSETISVAQNTTHSLSPTLIPNMEPAASFTPISLAPNTSYGLFSPFVPSTARTGTGLSTSWSNNYNLTSSGLPGTSTQFWQRPLSAGDQFDDMSDFGSTYSRSQDSAYLVSTIMCIYTIHVSNIM